jgi:hypothetical protein
MRCRHWREGPDSKSQRENETEDEAEWESILMTEWVIKASHTMSRAWAVKLERNEKIHMHNPSYIFPA